MTGREKRSYKFKILSIQKEQTEEVTIYKSRILFRTMYYVWLIYKWKRKNNNIVKKNNWRTDQWMIYTLWYGLNPQLLLSVWDVS